MGEDVARALGAASAEEWTVNGKVIKPRPLTMKEISEMQRDCVRQYRVQYLEKMQDDLKAGWITKEEFDAERLRTTRWDVEDLPIKNVYDTSEADITPEIDSFIRAHDKSSRDATDEQKRRWLGFALDSELITAEEFERRSGKPAVRQQTNYISWWVGGTQEGMLSLVWHTAKDSGFTREELEQSMAERQGELTQMARETEHLTAPSVEGNGTDSE